MDIPLLIEHFVNANEKAGMARLEPSPEMAETMFSYDWPGNVRELKHCMDRMAALNSEGALQMADLPSALLNHRAAGDLGRFSTAVEQGPLEEFRQAPKSPVISFRASERRTSHS